jgi:hypothetical protein
MDAYECMNADSDNAISTNTMYEHYNTAISPWMHTDLWPSPVRNFPLYWLCQDEMVPSNNS